MALLAGIEHDPMQRIEQLGLGRAEFLEARLLAAVEERRATMKYMRQCRLHEAPSEELSKAVTLQSFRLVSFCFPFTTE